MLLNRSNYVTQLSGFQIFGWIGGFGKSLYQTVESENFLTYVPVLFDLVCLSIRKIQWFQNS